MSLDPKRFDWFLMFRENRCLRTSSNQTQTIDPVIVLTPFVIYPANYFSSYARFCRCLGVLE